MGGPRTFCGTGRTVQSMVRPQFTAARFYRAGTTPIVVIALVFAVAALASVALVSDEAATVTTEAVVKEKDIPQADPVVDEVAQLLGVTQTSFSAKKHSPHKPIVKKKKKSAATTHAHHVAKKHKVTKKISAEKRKVPGKNPGHAKSHLAAYSSSAGHKKVKVVKK